MILPFRKSLRCFWAGFLAVSCLLVSTSTQAQTVETQYPAYLPLQTIRVAFTGGPGTKTDWIGIYPSGITPSGNPPSTIWDYVDSTQGGQAGVTAGTVVFPLGLGAAGDYTAFFLLRDGYTQAASSNFVVLDETVPLVQLGRRVTAGAAFDVSFFNAPGNARDWVGIYKAGQTPGAPGVDSTLWFYLDGTKTGNTAVPEGKVSFPTGLSATGEWVAYLLENDGYNVLSSQPFQVVADTSVKPRIFSIYPALGATEVPPEFTFNARITNGTFAAAFSSIQLQIDGAVVPHQAVTQNNGINVTTARLGLYAPLSTHTLKLTYQDNAVPANSYTAEGTFTIGDYRNLQLGTVIPGTFENFDAVPEGGIPAGWTRQSFTDIKNPDIDFGNLDSAAYATWVAVDVSRFRGNFVPYSDPNNIGDASDYQRVLSPNPFNVVNQHAITGPLATGRMLFANSGYRNGDSQYDILYTPDYDLTGRTGVAVSFHSLWEQNQDSLASLEFSTDRGTTWRPVFYLLHGPDIVKGSDPVTGAEFVDAVETFNVSRGDIAKWIDPKTGEQLGGTYGSMIGAAVSAELAPYLQARDDDNPVTSKRVEYYVIPGADNQKTVRFRFAHGGTDSWYWGIDDFGLYTPAAVTPPTLSITRNGDSITVSWTADGSFALLQSSSLSTPDWRPIANVTGKSVTLTATGAAQFFRLSTL